MAIDVSHSRFSDGTGFAEGHVYSFQIDNQTEWPGVIWGEPGIPRWRYTTDPKRDPWSPLNLLLGKPQFVVTEPDGREVLRVRRSSSTGFSPRFEIIEQEELVGSIVLSSLLRNRYTIQIGEEPTWMFHMPLFTIYFRAESAMGQEVLVRVGPSKKQWNVLAQPRTDSVYLLCALAFIHREWWAYS